MRPSPIKRTPAAIRVRKARSLAIRQVRSSGCRSEVLMISLARLKSITLLTPLSKVLFIAFVFVLVLFSANPTKAATINVPAGGDFQAALNNAQPGDTIVLQAGATFVGPFWLPVKSGSSYITVRTSAPDSSLPAADTRVTPAYANAMPKIVSSGYGDPALATSAGAHHFKFLGIEFKPLNGSAVVYDLIRFGDGSGAQNSLSQVPHHLTLDRCYVHGDPAGQLKRGVALNSGDTQIINSYISDCKGSGFDTQAIAGWNGPGPFTIINNYLEGAGENLMFGGADPSIPNMVPSDIEIRRNHINKPLSWRGVWSVKNSLELKNAQRVTIDGNLIENNWAHSQVGFAVVITVRNQDGSAPWSVVQDVQFTNNIVRHSGSAVSILGRDDVYPSQQAKRITIKNNLFDDINGSSWGGDGRFLQITQTLNTTVENNTVFHSGTVIMAYGAASTGFVFRNNVMSHNAYGIFGDNSSPGNGAINTYFPSGQFVKNLIAGASASSYPTNNFYPSTIDAAMFVDRPNGNYRLSVSSPYRNAGTDGRDIGCDFDALNAALTGTSNPTPTPTPTPTPVPTPTPTPTPSPTPVPGGAFVDDFNDNAIDPGKWVYSTIQGAIYTGPYAWDATVPVLERNQRLEISPRTNVTGDHYNGYVFANAWNMTNMRASVEILQTASGSSDTNLAVCLDSRNFYMISVESGQLRFEQIVNGVRTTVSVAFSAAQNRFWRIRHDASSDSIVFETSSDGQTWTQRRSVPRQIAIYSMRAEISAGTWEAVGSTGMAIFDNFRLESNNPQAALVSPSLVANAEQTAWSLGAQQNPSQANIQGLVTNIELAYTTFVGEYNRFSACTDIDKLLRYALASAHAARLAPRPTIRKRLMVTAQYLSDAYDMMQATGARPADVRTVSLMTRIAESNASDSEINENRDPIHYSWPPSQRGR